MFAIAAMSRNRVIGKGGGIPWRIPDELRWFRRTTMHGIVVMGRRTFESLPAPLDGRITVVLTRDPARLLEEERRRGRLQGAVVAPAAPGGSVQLSLPGSRTEVRLVRSLEPYVRAAATPERAWLCGGAQLYRQYLPACAELFLSVLEREVDGDTLFPPFEDLFDLEATVHEGEGFRVLHYTRNAVERPAAPGDAGALAEE